MRNSQGTKDQAAITATLPKCGSKTGRSRWYHFRVSTLLVLVAVCCAWLGVKANQSRLQQQIRSQLTNPRSSVRYRTESVVSPAPHQAGWLEKYVGRDFVEPLDAVSMYQESNTHSLVQAISRLRELRALTIRESDLDDHSVAYLQSSPRLEELTIDGTDISDQGLAVIGAMQQLTKLHVGSHSLVTPQGFAHLRRLRNLRDFALTVEQGHQLELLTSMPQIETLSLEVARLRPGDLTVLRQLAQLNDLSIRTSRLDREAIEELQGIPQLKRLVVLAWVDDDAKAALDKLSKDVPLTFYSDGW